MRKLLILALIAVAALVVMAADYTQFDPNDPDSWSISADLTVKVHSWLDATFNLYGDEGQNDGTYDIYDYGDYSNVGIGSLSLDSNDDIFIWKVEVTGDIPNGITVTEVRLDGVSQDFSYDPNNPTNIIHPEGNDTYTLYLDFTVDENTSAGDYSMTVEIYFVPKYDGGSLFPGTGT